MTRVLNSPVGDERSEFTYLYEIFHSGGVVRLTNASRDVEALTFTWTAVGGALLQGPVPDVADRKAQGVELSLFGVSQTIISLIQNNQFRGRLVQIYLIHADPDTGVFGVPDLIFRGRQNSDYKIKEDRDHDSTGSGGTVTVKTRVSSDLAAINSKISCRCSVPSHEEFLRRAGVGSPDDKFFDRVLSIMGTSVFWGSENPEKPSAPTAVDLARETLS